MRTSALAALSVFLVFSPVLGQEKAAPPDRALAARPGIEELLKKALKAQGANDLAAIRECLSTGTQNAVKGETSISVRFEGVKELKNLSLTLHPTGDWAFIRFQGPDGPRPLYLRKEDGEWRIEDEVRQAQLRSIMKKVEAIARKDAALAPTGGEDAPVSLRTKILGAADFPEGWVESEAAPAKYSITYISEHIRQELRTSPPPPESASFMEQFKASMKSPRIDYSLATTDSMARFIGWSGMAFYHGNGTKVEEAGAWDEAYSAPKGLWLRKGKIVVVLANVEQPLLLSLARKVAARL
ncbi:MAG: hypothetical protein HY928_04340 [Elusimicrobia bacterium]|nr:hypothetical protein [Elusimicrobiota bacterium]